MTDNIARTNIKDIENCNCDQTMQKVYWFTNPCLILGYRPHFILTMLAQNEKMSIWIKNRTSFLVAGTLSQRWKQMFTVVKHIWTTSVILIRCVVGIPLFMIYKTEY